MRKLVSIHKLKIITLLFISSSNVLTAQETQTFSTLSEVLVFSKNESYVFQNAKYELQLAALTKNTALGNVFNPKINTSATAINNINQQLSYLPAGAFGGIPGDFKQVIIGQQYVSTFSIQPQFDIFNLSSIAQVQSAKINEQLVENQNLISEQNLYDRINAVYFNILTLKGQKEIISENVSISESILKIISERNTQGIARKQEVNEAEVNVLTLKDKLEQIDLNIKIQYQILNLFFENKIDSELTQDIWDYKNDSLTLSTKSSLQTQNLYLQTQLKAQEFKVLRFQNYPTLSFISSFNLQNVSNEMFYKKNSYWQNYNYVGLRFNWELPTVQRISNLKSKQIQLDILKNTEEHTKIESNSKDLQLSFEYEKALKQIDNSQKIYALKQDSYEKNLNQFKENILSLDKLLISQNDMLISKLNVVTSLANVGFNKNKIEINNQF